MKLARLLVILAAAICDVGAAEAQIYHGRDANGTLVLSNRPLTPGMQSFPVGPGAAIRTTTPSSVGAAGAYHDLIEQQSASYQVRPDLVRAVIQVESAFNPRARSPKGAMGLMQLMPGTAEEMGVRNPYDPAQNIRGGIAYLRQLLDRYDNDEELALAAYNAGPTAVEEYGRTVPPYRETRRYVNRIRGMTVVSIPASERVIFKTIEIVNGRPVPRYSDIRPSTGDYEIVSFGP